MSTEMPLPTRGGVFVLIISATDKVLTSIELKLKKSAVFHLPHNYSKGRCHRGFWKY
jgi:hypothetical protein